MQNKNFCISSSYAKIFGETNFHAREIPRSGSKAKDGEEKKKKKERLNDGNNNGQLRKRIANTTSGGASKVAWPNKNYTNRDYPVTFGLIKDFHNICWVFVPSKGKKSYEF